jgi:hypothetical protein
MHTFVILDHYSVPQEPPPQLFDVYYIIMQSKPAAAQFYNKHEKLVMAVLLVLIDT